MWSSLGGHYSAFHRISYILFLLECLDSLLINTGDILRILATYFITGQFLALSIWKLSGANIHSTVYLVPGWGKVYNKTKQRTATKWWQDLFNYPHFIGEEVK